MLARGAVLAALWVAVGACQSAPTTGYEHHEVDLGEHLARIGLGPGDAFDVRVYGEEQLSGSHRVSSDGTIDFPFIGRVVVDGLTSGEVASLLREKLLDGFLVDPQVSVLVKEYSSKKIFVLGQVAKPGTFPYTPSMSVVEAITLAGGFTASANPDYVIVTRKRDGEDVRIPVPVEQISKGLAANLALQAGDIVFVADRML